MNQKNLQAAVKVILEFTALAVPECYAVIIISGEGRNTTFACGGDEKRTDAASLKRLLECFSKALELYGLPIISETWFGDVAEPDTK